MGRVTTVALRGRVVTETAAQTHSVNYLGSVPETPERNDYCQPPPSAL